MNRQPMLAQIEDEIEENMPDVGAWQSRGLGVLVVGLWSLGQAQLSKMAEGVPEEGSYNTVRQRVKRWVSNPRLEVLLGCEAWTRWVWRSFGGSRAVLLVDETKLGERFGIMLVSLAYAGRAIPLVWRVYYANDAQASPPQGPVLLIYGLLAPVLMVLAVGARPLVQMDRGLAHSSAMLRALYALHLDFLVRVKASARFTSQHGLSLRHWLRPGMSPHLSGTLFDKDHAVKGTICLVWEPGQQEAWCWFTNVRRHIGYAYAVRWWQEESFRDLKSAGWSWPTSPLACPVRMERLILVMATAYAFAIRLGLLVWTQPPRLRAETATPDELPRLSLFRLGLPYLHRILADVTPLPTLSLSFPPPAFFCRI